MPKLDISSLKRTNFKAEDFIASETATENKIDNNVYEQEVLDNLQITADKAQEIRVLLGKPIKINSGFRCEKLNLAVGSKPTSQHRKGQAIDFVCPSFGTPEKIVKHLKSTGLEVDQMLCEGSWVHCSIKKEGNRNQYAYYLPDKNGKRRLIIITDCSLNGLNKNI